MKTNETEILAELQELKSKVTTFDESKRTKVSQIQAFHSKIQSAKSKLKALQVGKNELEEIKVNISSEQEEINQYQQKISETEKSVNINGLEESLVELESKTQKLRDEMSILNLQGDTRAKLSIKQTEKRRKEESLAKLSSTVEAELADILNIPFNLETIEQDMKSALSMRNKSIKIIREKHMTASASMSAVESKLAEANATLSKKTVELESNDLLILVNWQE